MGHAYPISRESQVSSWGNTSKNQILHTDSRTSHHFISRRNTSASSRARVSKPGCSSEPTQDTFKILDLEDLRPESLTMDSGTCRSGNPASGLVPFSCKAFGFWNINNEKYKGRYSKHLYTCHPLKHFILKYFYKESVWKTLLEKN